MSTLTLPIAFRGLFDASFAEPRARARRAENRVSSGRAASTDLLRADRGRARSEGGCINAMALLGESSSSETSSHARSSGAHATAMAPPSIFPISRIPVPVPARARSIAGIDSGSRPRLRGGLCRRPRVGRTRWRRPDARASAKVRRGAWFFPDKYLDKRAHGREKRESRVETSCFSLVRGSRSDISHEPHSPRRLFPSNGQLNRARSRQKAKVCEIFIELFGGEKGCGSACGFRWIRPETVVDSCRKLRKKPTSATRDANRRRSFRRAALGTVDDVPPPSSPRVVPAGVSARVDRSRRRGRGRGRAAPRASRRVRARRRRPSIRPVPRKERTNFKKNSSRENSATTVFTHCTGKKGRGADAVASSHLARSRRRSRHSSRARGRHATPAPTRLP